MADPRYTASKSRSQGRSAWSIIFRHPLRKTPSGKEGLRIRRGLGTSDEAQADALVHQMNALLQAERFWSLPMRGEAEKHFDSVIVSAFYDALQVADAPVAEASADDAIPLPTAEDGYRRVLLVGTTGAGKTSLLRHLIGSDPKVDRFPSTSTSRTTIADIEVVTAPGPYQAAVTFFSEWSTRTSIHECVAEACLTAWQQKDDAKVAEALLYHQDQRFRLSYILGDWVDAADCDEEDWTYEEDGNDGADEEPDYGERPAPEDIQRRLREYVVRVKALAKRVAEPLREAADGDYASLSGEDLEIAQELFQEDCESSREFDDIVNDIIDDVLRRFDRVKAGTLTRDRGDWPVVWTFDTQDRETFIEQIRWFSNNHAAYFGSLLTPLVSAIRVKGPFYPRFSGQQPKLVLIDGQGLGHTPDSSSAVTRHITQRFGDVDVILLVDNAQQPMQAAPLSVVRVLGAYGYDEKLAIAFTHFDSVVGDNLRTPRDKRLHVLGSVTNGLNGLRATLSNATVNAIERTLDSRCFMLAFLDKPIDASKSGKITSELVGLVDFLDGRTAAVEEEEEFVEPEPTAAPAPPLPALADAPANVVPLRPTPVYDMANLQAAVQAATREFHKRWNARLGLEFLPGESKQHWTRMKALNRRVALQLGDYEYDTLKPLAEIVERLMESIGKSLELAVEWSPATPSEAHAERSMARIKQELAASLDDMMKTRMILTPIKEWVSAYNLSGRGSTFDRARRIKGVYDTAAPIPGNLVSSGNITFMQEMKRLMTVAVEKAGGRVK